jgi:hypothetical protein
VGLSRASAAPFEVGLRQGQFARISQLNHPEQHNCITFSSQFGFFFFLFYNPYIEGVRVLDAVPHVVVFVVSRSLGALPTTNIDTNVHGRGTRLKSCAAFDEVFPQSHHSSSQVVLGAVRMGISGIYHHSLLVFHPSSDAKRLQVFSRS